MARSLFFGIVIAITLAAPTSQAGTWLDCELSYDLKSWAVFYKEARGSGVVRCSNGQKASVRLQARGGGLAFGKTEIVGGKGQFSRVRDIGEVFGTYAQAEAGAAAGEAAAARVLTKGEVSLALTGTGRGVELGFAFGGFTIERN